MKVYRLTIWDGPTSNIAIEELFTRKGDAEQSIAWTWSKVPKEEWPCYEVTELEVLDRATHF